MNHPSFYVDLVLWRGNGHCFLNFVHRSISIMKVAQAKLKEIGPDDMNMEEYKVRSSLYVYKANI